MLELLLIVLLWAVVAYCLMVLVLWIALVPFVIYNRLGFWSWVYGAFLAVGWLPMLIWASRPSETRGTYVLGSRKLRNFMEANNEQG